jgi:serine/threonine protein kinase
MDCPSVLPLLDVHTDALPFEATSMPLAAGTLGGAGPIPASAAKQQMLRVITALQYCHGRSILHGDVKPTNTFIDQHGHAQLGDFGIADYLPEDRRGYTLEYATPELLAGEARTAESDIWAATVMYYELLGGEMPFGTTADDPEAIVATRIAAGRFRPIGDLRPYLPRGLQALFKRAFAVDPALGSVTSAAEALNAIANIPLLADWVRVRKSGVLERWEGMERDNDGNATGTTFTAELVQRARPEGSKRPSNATGRGAAHRAGRAPRPAKT